MSSKRKVDGGITIWALGLILAVCAVFGIMYTFISSQDVHTQIQNAAEEAARVRAQAVDTYLKEATGYVEVFHPDGLEYSDNINHLEFINVKGHHALKTPSQYQTIRHQADTAAKEAAIETLKGQIGLSLKGEKLVTELKEENICIKVFPLPTSDAETKTLSCDTALGPVTAQNVRVSPIKDNTYTVTLDTDGSKQEVKVVNAVFVGIKYEHHYQVEALFEEAGVDPSTILSAFSIAYPQVDKCFGNHC